MRTVLNGTGHVSAPSSAALVVPSVHVLFVSSVESIDAQKNMLAAAATYEAVLASEAPHLQMSHSSATLTAANTRANSAPQWRRYKSCQESGCIFSTQF